MITITSTKQLSCSQCGNRLILVKKTEAKDTFSKVITTIYKCSDKICQEGIDKRTKALLKLQKEQNSAKKARLKAKMRVNKKKILR